MMNIKKILTIFLILMVLLPSVYAADTKAVDGKTDNAKDTGKVDVSPSDIKPITDDTKEKATKITNKDQSITGDITITTKDVRNVSAKKNSDTEIAISMKEDKGKHTKALVAVAETALKEIDADGDGKFGVLRVGDNGEILDKRILTTAQLTSGAEMVFTTNVINGYSGYKQYTFSSVTSGQTLNIDDVSGNYSIAVAVSGTVPGYVAGIPTSGLLAEWTFDNSNYVDTSGNGHNGTKTGNVSFVTDKNGGKCLYFNGTAGYINVGTIALGNKNATIIADIKPYKTTSTVTRSIFSRYYQQNALLLSATTGTSVHRMNSVQATGTSPYTNSSWAQTALTYDGLLASNQIKTYRNAVLVKNGTLTADITNEVRGWTIGAQGTDEPSYFFIGYVDNVRAYTQALPASEMKQVYAGGSGISFKPSPSYNFTGYNVASGVEKVIDTDSTCTGIEVVNTAGTTLSSVTITVYFTEDTTLISDIHNSQYQNVSIVHTALHNMTNGTIAYELLSAYTGTPSIISNNTNASVGRNTTHVLVYTGLLKVNDSFYYNVSVPVDASESLVNPTFVITSFVVAGGGFVIASWWNQRRKRGAS